ncbi:proteasome assembly chaperone 1 [Lepeophtheirus salmonis]|nr:proteasome assembly chaperone 1-like [Lepeophtheirus salmonis]
MEATFFGETVSVPSRRFDEEDELEDNSAQSIKNYVVELDANPKKVFLAVDKLSKAFCKVYLISSNDAVGQIYETDEEDNELRTEKCAFYKTLDSSSLVCVTKGTDPFMPIKFARKFLEALHDDVQIFILRNNHLSFYKSVEPSDVSVVTRILKTSKCDVNLKIPTLEEPNFVSRTPAAVMSMCEYLDRKCLLMFSFTDSFEPDSISISGFLPLLKFVTPLEDIEVQSRIKKLAFEIQTDQIYM